MGLSIWLGLFILTFFLTFLLNSLLEPYTHHVRGFVKSIFAKYNASYFFRLRRLDNTVIQEAIWIELFRAYSIVVIGLIWYAWYEPLVSLFSEMLGLSLTDPDFSVKVQGHILWLRILICLLCAGFLVLFVRKTFILIGLATRITRLNYCLRELAYLQDEIGVRLLKRLIIKANSKEDLVSLDGWLNKYEKSIFESI